MKNNYINHLTVERGLSPLTVRAYEAHLSAFLAHCDGIINEDTILAYRGFLNERGLSKATQNYHLIAIRSYLKYLRKKGQGDPKLNIENIGLAKSTRPTFDLITQEELSKLLQAPNTETLKGVRDKAILETLFASGLRVAEMLSLPRDVDFKNKSFTVKGKGGRNRLVFISKPAFFAILRYNQSRTDQSLKLFPLTARAIQQMIRHYAVVSGITKKVTPHVMRHLYATTLLSNGADMRSVQILLGHASIATTQIYSHVTDSALKETYSKFHVR